jgi:hypothetical protein
MFEASRVESGPEVQGWELRYAQIPCYLGGPIQYQGERKNESLMREYIIMIQVSWGDSCKGLRDFY